MRISNACPIQFYSNSQKTFNEEVTVGNVVEKFYQPFLSEDDITIQVLTNDSSSIILDIIHNDVDIHSINFVNITGNVWQLNFVAFSVLGVYLNMYEKHLLAFRVRKDTEALTLITPFSSWVNAGGGTQAWLWDGLSQWEAELAIGEESEYLRSTFTGASVGDTVTIFTSPVAVADVEYKWGFLNSSNVILSEDDLTNSIVIPTGAAYIFLRASNTSEAFIRTAILVSPTSAVKGGGIFYRSDLCLFATTHRGARVIQYSDKSLFAGINYNISPIPIFKLMVLSKFYDFRFPDESEPEDGSNSITDVLSSSSKTQRLLEVEPCPAYLHKKIQLILQHNTIAIEGQFWVKEEGYSLEDLDKRHPFKLGKVWLTEKLNQFVTNVYASITPVPNVGIFDDTFDSTFE